MSTETRAILCSKTGRTQIYTRFFENLNSHSMRKVNRIGPTQIQMLAAITSPFSLSLIGWTCMQQRNQCQGLER